MSIVLLPLAFEYEGDLKGNEKLVLLYLCNLSNDGKGNYAWPSHKYLAKKSGLSLATVKRVCKSLKEKGFINWIYGKYVDNKNCTNHYIINQSLLKGLVKSNKVLTRATHKGHPDTCDSVIVSDNNLLNNLSYNLNINQKPRPKPSNTPPTPTTTHTKTKVSNSYYFLKFWENIPNKVSKGIVENNYLKLEHEWLEQPEKLADMYKNYYESIEDKQFAKQPAFWLSAKKYLDEQPKKKDTTLADPYVNRLKMFKDAIESKMDSSFIKRYAQRYPSDVERAICEGQFTKQQAIKFLDFRI
jgi:hypothetical protein